MVPRIRFGTFRLPDGATAELAVALAPFQPESSALRELDSPVAVSNFMTHPQDVLPILVAASESLGPLISDFPPDLDQPVPILVWLAPEPVTAHPVSRSYKLYEIREDTRVADLRAALRDINFCWQQQVVSLLLNDYDRLYPPPSRIHELPPHYLMRVRAHLHANSVSHYALCGRREQLRPRTAAGVSPSNAIDYRTASQLLAFNASVTARCLDGPTACHLLGQDNAPTSTLVVCSYHTEEAIPSLLLFEFDNPIDVTGLEHVCHMASREFRHIHRGCRLLRHTACLEALAESQRFLPNRDQVIYEVCKQLRSYFATPAASLLSVVADKGNRYRLRKVYVHHEPRRPVTFSTEHGYAFHCLRQNKALLITHTDDNEQTGTGLEYELDNIRVGGGRPVTLHYTVAPETVENERCLIVVPLPSLESLSRKPGVLKIGSFEAENAFDVSDLSALASCARHVSALLCAVELAERLRTVVGSVRLTSDVQEDAATLFTYRDLAVEIFHQLSHYLDATEIKLAAAGSEATRLRPPPEQLVDDIKACKLNTREGKRLLRAVRDRGQSLEQIPADCLLLRDVVRPALSRANRRIRGKWTIGHTLTQREFPVYLDAFLLIQSLYNILSNAIWAVNQRHSSDTSKRITVIVRPLEDGEHVRIDIEDNGIGMRREEQSRAFDKWFTTRGKQGSGLGLHIARKLITEVDGTIEIARSSYMSGTTIRIVLAIMRGTS